MFKWKTLRTFAVLLIALPVIQLVYSLSTGLAQYVDPSPEAWAEELERIIEADTKLSLPEKPILVVGGQRVRLWRDLNEALAPQPTLLRPLGDATIDDLTFHYDRLIGHYRPDTLVIVPGYSDLHLRDSKSPEAFLNAVSELLALDTEYGYTRMRILMTPILMPPAPGRRPAHSRHGDCSTDSGLKSAQLGGIRSELPPSHRRRASKSRLLYERRHQPEQ